ncbi:hypothetical protein K501DRAFT_334512 [Backusella circina FSU 941]|nr:hypothetical protein K501DRAFT_334512 [Backusella circina FSU 941]
MNKLSFGAFHAKHFSPEQKAYWRSFLQQNQQNYQQYDSSVGEAYYEEEEVEMEQDEMSNDEEDEFNDLGLSKETIEILEFSENYRRQREEERLALEKEEKEGIESWEYDESTVFCSGGVEAPATSLVLTKKEKPKSVRLRIEEDLLNSAYLASCVDKDDKDIPVLWPIVPLNL